MRQAVIIAPEQFAVREAPRPQLRGPGEILLRTIACGLCSGDLMPWYLDARSARCWATNRSVGPSRSARMSRTFSVATLSSHIIMPRARSASSAVAAPMSTVPPGSEPLDPGGMAEFIRVPAEIVAADAFAVNELHPEQALFIEPIGCCVKAYEGVLGLHRNRELRIVVVGCGIMGLLNIQVALAYGAAEVIAVEPVGVAVKQPWPPARRGSDAPGRHTRIAAQRRHRRHRSGPPRRDSASARLRSSRRHGVSVRADAAGGAHAARSRRTVFSRSFPHACLFLRSAPYRSCQTVARLRIGPSRAR